MACLIRLLPGGGAIGQKKEKERGKGLVELLHCRNNSQSDTAAAEPLQRAPGTVRT